ncbi:quinone oxidoreductase [Anaerolineae bacterium CFX7]|nr:quinone oxidoreductase [Anaerolineae bacterium CFX7]
MFAVRIHETGGPDVLRYEEIETPQPGAGQVRVKLHAIGINYIDTYHRTGLYKLPLPAILGREGAGVIDAIGDTKVGNANVGNADSNIPPPDVPAIGERVAFVLDAPSYAEYALVPAQRVVRVPDAVSFEDAAAVLLQGLTAHYLCRSAYPLKTDEWCLLHAAAGGAGQLTLQVAKMIGARVIGTVSTEEKARVARALGCDEVINYSQDDFVARVRELTNGKGVSVVYDSVGKDTWAKSLDCLSPRGMLVLWGNASGATPPIDPLTLMSKGSLYLTRPTLGHYIATREEYQSRARDLFQWLAEGSLRVRIDKTFALRDAAAAQRYLESRAAAGKILLKP